MNCRKLSPEAFGIFKKLEQFYLPDPWGEPQWFKNGIVLDNGRYDLRKKKDRKEFEEKIIGMVGFL